MATGALEGKAIVITGSTSGIGAAYARAAAAEGARVVVNGTNAVGTEQVVAEIRARGGVAVGHPANVAVWDEAAALVQRSVDEFGRIDGLVNNAGVQELSKPELISESAFRRMIGINLLGTAFCGVHAMRRMLERGHGSIVNTVSGAMIGIPFMSAYGASKGGVAALTWSWAADLAGSGVRVNAVSPIAWTRMADTTERPEGYEGNWEAQKRAVAHLTPEGNAPAVLFLLSDRAAGIHGQVVRIEGQALSLIRRPEVLAPVRRSEPWTIEAVADAFAGELGRELQPVTPLDQLSLLPTAGT